MRGRILAVAAAAVVSMAAPAKAAVIQDFSDFQSGTNGIVLGPDGNFWIAEEFNEPGSVVRMTPSGQVLNRYSVGDSPTSIINGTNGRVWVSVREANRLTWFDATSPSPTAHNISTLTAGTCGPVGLAAGAGDNRLYFTLPNPDPGGDDDCGPVSRIATMPEAGGTINFSAAGGEAFDLAISNGKLYVPDVDDGLISRIALGTGFTVETTISAPFGPDGITADGNGTIWVTQVGGTIARVPATQNGGSVQTISPVGDSLGGDPFGILAAPDGRIYVAGGDSGKFARYTPSSGAWQFVNTGGSPWDIAAGPDDDIYFSDRARTFVHRWISTAPRAVTGAATPLSATAAAVTANVDPRGNATTVSFDYGTTAAYGSTVNVAVEASVGARTVPAALAGLTPGTTYHVRVRATNDEGGVTGADTTFLTPSGDADGDGVAPPLDCNDKDASIHPGAVDKPGDKIDQNCDGKDASFPSLKAESHFSWGFLGARTVLTKVTVQKLAGGETIKVTCSSKSKGCPFKTKTYKKVKKGTRSLGSLFGRKHPLKTGAKVVVRVTATDKVGSSSTLTIGKTKKDPKIKRAKVNP